MALDSRFDYSSNFSSGRRISLKIQNQKIVLDLPKNIFLPHSDSLLLANSIKIHSSDIVLDIGLGSGILGITAAKLGALHVYGNDINSAAVSAAKLNAQLNKVDYVCSFKKGRTFDPFSTVKFDAIVINPPQTPGRGKEPWYFTLATNGGCDGTFPTMRLLRSAVNHLTPHGRVYLPLKEWMDWKKVLKEIHKNYACKVLGTTFSPVWTQDPKRLKLIEKLIQSKKARVKLIHGKKYHKIYALECTLK